jgi:2-(1,2-epoxy-1,2-dihydrophenyl)acetyl-CoA isomerase
VVAEAMTLAKSLAEGPTVALALTRRLYWDSPLNGFEDQLDMEARMQKEAGASSDFKEGVSAFLQKRPAKFTGH